MINIVKSYEGIESLLIVINDGEIEVNSNDDGLNVVGGNDGSAMSRGPGQGGFDYVDGKLMVSMTVDGVVTHYGESMVGGLGGSMNGMAPGNGVPMGDRPTMKDNDRAVIIGEKTGGGQGIKLNGKKFEYLMATWRYFRKNGRLVEGRGIESDLPMKIVDGWDD